jgi:alkylation response protein AidB-like acyl-CoA dehydrogenase
MTAASGAPAAPTGAPEALAADPESFREQCRQWLADNVTGEFAELVGRGGPGDEEFGFDVRVAWERHLGAAGWIGLGWPAEFGGRGASVAQQVIWAEEYTRAGAPERVNHMGENLLGPTLIEFGTDAQRQRFLPPILDGTERWCQGYSEPNAGSDLAGVQTRARLEGDEWVIDGQKVWTSLAHVSHWCFVVARTEVGSQRSRGLSFLLVPMDQPGVEVRPIVQITGGGEFNETFFDDARTPADLVVGEAGNGWAIAMALLAYERGISTLAQQVGFAREFDEACALARRRQRAADPVTRQRLAASYSGLQLMRWNALRSMSAGVPGPEASISKLFWAGWHRSLGELLVDLDGPDALVTAGDGYDLTPSQRLFLFTRADTIYGGSDEIQRNILAERVLGLPREPR